MPVPAANFHDSGEYDAVEPGEYYYADDHADRDDQCIHYKPDVATR